MKTSLLQLVKRNPKIMTDGMKLGTLALILFLFSSCATSLNAQRPHMQVNISLPLWAPAYENVEQVRYYYLPDIECYYDVPNREFIFMEDGEWMFSPSLPSRYGWFDLNASFIVVLDQRVFQPWRHFHYYVSHYPRYYYRTVYRDAYNDRYHPIRGFNENERRMVYRHNEQNEQDHERSNSVIYRNESRNEIKKRYENREDSREVNVERRNERESPERKAENVRQSEKMEYYGKEIGRPVRVQRNMKKAEEPATRNEKRTESEGSTRRGRER